MLNLARWVVVPWCHRVELLGRMLTDAWVAVRHENEDDLWLGLGIQVSIRFGDGVVLGALKAYG